jgi:hypothetical protein
MPLQATSGAASYDAFGGGVPVVTNYIEDVFSTYLYDPTGDPLTITNGIDLSGKGGLVWLKNRTVSANHYLYDTARGATSGNAKYIVSNSSAAQSSGWPNSLAVTNSGFTLGGQAATPGEINNFGYPVVSWTFRKQPKFFDVVTWTGNGVDERVIPHSLGSDVGAIIIKRTDTTSNWHFAINDAVNTKVLRLNTTEAAYPTTANMLDNGYASINGFYTPSSTGFALINGSTNFTQVNASGGTYVAYVFAHDAGGFGLTGTDNVISCGSYTSAGASTEITLGYEPQWVLVKKYNASGDNWKLLDNMRGMYVAGSDKPSLSPNLTAIDDYFSNYATAIATGFVVDGGGLNDNGDSYIYIAIRRGPMKVPTSGTSVFAPIARAGTSAATSIGGGSFTTDLIIAKARNTSPRPVIWANRLTNTLYLESSSTSAQSSSVGTFPTNATWDIQQGIKVGSGNDINGSAYTYINYFLGRAPSVMDVVCYTGTGTAMTVAHNLTVVPEMMIVKPRSSVSNWQVFHKDLNALGTQPADDSRIRLNVDSAATANNTIWDSTLPTSTVFSVGASSDSNGSGDTLVAYLFATCAGVSKVGSYTGTATTLQIDCGFTGGARWIMIKRQNSTGDWYVWDSARGIVSGNDPYLLLNSTAAEVTSTDYIDTYSAGFEISSTAPAAINASGGKYIFLAIA